MRKLKKANVSEPENVIEESDVLVDYLDSNIKPIELRYSSESSNSERARLITDSDSTTQSSRISYQSTDISDLNGMSDDIPVVRQIQQGSQQQKPTYTKSELALKVLTIGVLIYLDYKILETNAEIKKDLKILKEYF